MLQIPLAADLLLELWISKSSDPFIQRDGTSTHLKSEVLLIPKVP